MKTRVLSGVGIVAVTLAVGFLGSYFLAISLCLISLIAYHELCMVTKVRLDDTSVSGLEVIGSISIIVNYSLLLFRTDLVFFLICILFSMVAFMFIYVLRFPRYDAKQIMAAFFSMIYGPVMLAFVFLTRQQEYGVYTIWLIFLSSWVSDTAAYFTGVNLGKHKLAPELSPKKSVEGSIGGVLGAALAGAIYGYLFAGQFTYGYHVIWVFACICAVGSIVSQIGDLAASAIKRNYGVKDYGKILPGHGGIMDRFDSVIFTAPMIYFLVMLLLR